MEVLELKEYTYKYKMLTGLEWKDTLLWIAKDMAKT